MSRSYRYWPSTMATRSSSAWVAFINIRFMLVHPLGRGSPCSRRLSGHRGIGHLRHHRVQQGERREGRDRQEKHGTPSSADTDCGKPGQWPPAATGRSPHTYSRHPGHPSRRAAQADTPDSPVSPAVRAGHPECFVASRAARPLVPASTTGDSQARKFASFAACDAAPSLAIERRALFTFPVVVRGPYGHRRPATGDNAI
jgi:hypothetical protein